MPYNTTLGGEENFKESTILRWNTFLDFDSFMEFEFPIEFFIPNNKQRKVRLIDAPIRLILNGDKTGSYLLSPKFYYRAASLMYPSEIVAPFENELKDILQIIEGDLMIKLFDYAGLVSETEVNKEDLPADGILFTEQHHLVMVSNTLEGKDEEIARLKELGWEKIISKKYVLLPHLDYILWGNYEKNNKIEVISY